MGEEEEKEECEKVGESSLCETVQDCDGTIAMSSQSGFPETDIHGDVQQGLVSHMEEEGFQSPGEKVEQDKEETHLQLKEGQIIDSLQHQTMEKMDIQETTKIDNDNESSGDEVEEVTQTTNVNQHQNTDNFVNNDIEKEDIKDQLDVAAMNDNMEAITQHDINNESEGEKCYQKETCVDNEVKNISEDEQSTDEDNMEQKEDEKEELGKEKEIDGRKEEEEEKKEEEEKC